MPNWCFTTYKIEGDKKEIQDLYQKLNSLSERKESLIKNDFGKNWLGNVVHLFGGNWEDIYCRGTFESLEILADGILQFDTETAWVEINEVWEFVKKSYPSIQYFWVAEECACEYYATNDTEGKYYPDRFIIEQGDSEREYYVTEQAALDDVANIIGKPANDWSQAEALVVEYNKLNEDNTVGMHRISVVE